MEDPSENRISPVLFPFYRVADVKKNHGNDTYIRHVTPVLHVPPSSASGHFRDYRAARNE